MEIETQVLVACVSGPLPHEFTGVILHSYVWFGIGVNVTTFVETVPLFIT